MSIFGTLNWIRILVQNEILHRSQKCQKFAKDLNALKYLRHLYLLSNCWKLSSRTKYFWHYVFWLFSHLHSTDSLTSFMVSCKALCCHNCRLCLIRFVQIGNKSTTQRLVTTGFISSANLVEGFIPEATISQSLQSRFHVFFARSCSDMVKKPLLPLPVWLKLTRNRILLAVNKLWLSVNLSEYS